MNLKPIKKVVAALLGGLTTTGVITAAHEWLGWDVSQGLAALIVAVAGAVAGYLVPDKRVS